MFHFFDPAFTHMCIFMFHFLLFLSCFQKLPLYNQSFAPYQRLITHTLAGCYAGTAVDQNGGEDGAKHLEALLRFVSAPQLDTEQGEDCGCCCLLLCAAWRQHKDSICLSVTAVVVGCVSATRPPAYEGRPSCECI